jgi:hypothetical protein
MKELLAIFVCMGVGWMAATSISRPMSKSVDDNSVAAAEDEAFVLEYTREVYRNAD